MLEYKHVILAISTITLALLMILFSFTSILLGLKSELNLNATQFGSLLSMFSIFYAVSQIPCGILSDRYGGRKVATTAMLIMGSSSLVFSFSGSYAQVLLLRTLIGLSGGFILPAVVKLLSNWYPSTELSKAMGIMGLGQGMGFLITYALGSILVELFGWRGASALVGLVIICVAVLACVILREAGKEQVTAQSVSAGKTEGRMFANTLFLFVLINFTALSVVSGVVQFAPEFLGIRLGISSITGGVIVSVIGITNMVSSYVGGSISRRIGGSNVLLASVLMCVVFPFLLACASSILHVVVLAALVGFGTMLYFGPTFAAVPQTARAKDAAKTFGVFNTISFGASAVSPMIFGYVLDTTGKYQSAFASLSVIALAGLFGAILLKRSRLFTEH